MGRKELATGLVLVVLAAFALDAFLGRGDTPEKAALRLEAGTEVPAIGLDRLGRPDPGAAPPLRDVFKFGPGARADWGPVPTPAIRLSPLPAPTALPASEAEPTPWPALNVTLIGIVDNGAGGKIASFVKDGEIVLVGQPGQVLGNAFRVLRIGAESAEIEEMGSGRTRRLALRTN